MAHSMNSHLFITGVIGNYPHPCDLCSSRGSAVYIWVGIIVDIVASCFQELLVLPSSILCFVSLLVVVDHWVVALRQTYPCFSPSSKALPSSIAVLDHIRCLMLATTW
eukprot:1321116-Amphidinium_carterae.2